MAKYKKCPRCEINYILEEADYCEVCKAELKGDKTDDYELDELEEEDSGLCPRCHKNYLSEGEKICAECAQKEEYGNSHSLTEDIEIEADETEETDIDTPLELDDESEWESLEGLQDDEMNEEEEDEEEEEIAPDKDEFEELGDIDSIEDPDDEDDDSDDIL